MYVITRFFQDIILNLKQYKTHPENVKLAINYLFVAWLMHYVSIYILSQYIPLEGRFMTQMYFIGPAVFILVFSMRNWARMLCILCQALSITLYLFLLTLFAIAMNLKFGMICVVNLILFSLSTYFLARKETADYMKEEDRKLKAEIESRIKTEE